MAAQFCAEINRLEGKTIGQRRKNFFLLLNANTTLKNQPEVLRLIASNWKPQSALELLFKTEFLIYFRRTPELYDLLKEGNDIIISKITKHGWFFKEVFTNISAIELVNDVLPIISYSVRMKVLNKISKFVAEDKFDEIFDALVLRYGIYIATRFITGCSVAKIRQVYADYPVQLNQVQLKIIYKKDPSFFEIYYEHEKCNFNIGEYKELLRFIFIENPQLYLAFTEKMRNGIQFGRRTTKKYIQIQKNDIIKNPRQYLNYLNMKTVFRTLGKESTILYANALPSKIEDLEHPFNMQQFLQCSNKRYHYSLYVKTTENHYQKKFRDYPKIIDSFMLDLISDSNERAQLAKVKYDLGDEEYVKYLLIPDSIRLIKEKINVTSRIADRSKLVKMLIETCHINKDQAALFEVMKYFIFRHKNDDLHVHLEFIYDIEKFFGFRDFSTEMWALLNDLLTIDMLKYDKNADNTEKLHTLPLISFNKGTSHLQKLSYLKFLFDNGQPIDELLWDYIKNTRMYPDWQTYGKNFVKYYILFSINNSNKLLEEDNNENFENSIIVSICEWNKDHKDDIISIFDYPNLVKTFYHVIRMRSYLDKHIRHLFKEYIFTSKQNNLRNEHLQIYWERVDTFGCYKDFRWFLTYQPEEILNHLDSLMQRTFKLKPYSQLQIYYCLKKLSYYNLDQKAIDYCNTQLENKNYKYHPALMRALSALLPSEDYIALAESYAPTITTVDLKDVDAVRRFDLQISIVKSFKNVKSHQAIPTVLKYCVGDYFSDASGSLYSLLFHTPENLLPPYLEELSKTSGSIKKHVLYLTSALTTIENVERILNVLNQTEKSDFLQREIFETTVNYFVKNPLDSIFKILKRNMRFITKNDSESLTLITSVAHRLSMKYRASYTQYSWEYLESIVDLEKTLNALLSALLNVLDETIIKEIPFEFGCRIIKENLLQKNPLKFADNFVLRFLINRNEKEEIYALIFDIINETTNTIAIPYVFNVWYADILCLKDVNLDFLKPFFDFWIQKINPIESFEEYILLFFLKCKMDITKDEHDELATRISNFVEELNRNYGPLVLSLFARLFHENICYCLMSSQARVEFYDKLTKNHPTPLVYFVVLEAVTLKDIQNAEKKKPALKGFLKRFQASTDVQVKIVFRNRFKSWIHEQEAENILNDNN